MLYKLIFNLKSKKYDIMSLKDNNRDEFFPDNPDQMFRVPVEPKLQKTVLNDLNKIASKIDPADYINAEPEKRSKILNEVRLKYNVLIKLFLKNIRLSYPEYYI